LKNAVKFTPEAGQVSVKTHACTASDALEIRIIDTGIGMSPDELEHVFNAFAQGEHAIRGDLHRFGGVGLGLAISRMLIELHEGQITASSAGRGQGATFAITLPLWHEAETRTGADRITAQPAAMSNASNGEGVATRGRILLIEDHQPTRRTLTRLLTRRHYEVTAAASVAEAHVFASQARFDLVISDIGLPDGDGYTLMTELRTAQPDLMGIALSGYGMEDDLSRSRTAGFTKHLIKPIQIGDLERALDDLLPAPQAKEPRDLA
jgi:CheY-like chemotaxis protein